MEQAFRKAFRVQHGRPWLSDGTKPFTDPLFIALVMLYPYGDGTSLVEFWGRKPLLNLDGQVIESMRCSHNDSCTMRHRLKPTS
jgi:hypothetical protein